MNDVLRSLNSDLSDVIANVGESLVHLSNGQRGNGAGTIWHKRGLILTNAHVVQRRAPQVTLRDGRRFRSRLLALDERLDLAALAIDAEELPTIELGDSRLLRPGEWVMALGHPWGVNGAASAGAVISVGRPLEMSRYSGDLVQTSLWLRPGHSGGPLVDSSGRLVGINTMISGPQVGLAIPAHVVKGFLKQKRVPTRRAVQATA